jgi:hypothetical protein
MNKALIILVIIITSVSCKTRLKLQGDSFNKKKWLTSSSYRYEIAKSHNFPDFRGKSKDDVKHILGNPDEVNGEVFIYCFDLNSIKYYDQELHRDVCHCKGSYVTIDFEIDERFRTTFSWVETTE